MTISQETVEREEAVAVRSKTVANQRRAWCPEAARGLGVGSANRRSARAHRLLPAAGTLRRTAQPWDRL